MIHTLIVCRNLKDSLKLRKVLRGFKGSCVVASDDIAVHRAFKNHPQVKDVCWLESMESFYCVADDVLEILENVNGWLKMVAGESRKINGELLFWIRHCEGGVTTQRLQDILLLIRSCQDIVKKYSPSRIVVVENADFVFENDIFVEVARCLMIPVTTLGGKRFMFVLRHFYDRSVNALKLVYFVVNLMRIGLLEVIRGKTRIASSNDVVFQVCSSALKHLENVVPLMAEMKRRGYDVIALCWDAAERMVRQYSSRFIRKSGLDAIQLERMVSIGDVIHAMASAYVLWRSACMMKSRFVEDDRLSYRSVQIGRLLWAGMLYFIWNDYPQRYLLGLAMKKYLNANVPLAIKYWGNGVLQEGAVATRVLKKKPKCVFDYFLGANIHNPYAIKDDKRIDLFLAAGAIEQKIVTYDFGLDPKKVIAVGKMRYGNAIRSVQEISPEESRRILKINLNYKYFIFYDPGCVMRGIESYAEHTRRATTLFDFVKDHSDVALIVKPHPSADSSVLERICEEYALSNVVVLDRSALPYHAINAADLVVTKMSTIALEAIMLSKVVIGVLLDNEERFKIYGDAITYVTSTDQLKSMLEFVTADVEAHAQLMKNQERKQYQFCRNYLLRSGDGACINAADALCGALAPDN